MTEDKIVRWHRQLNGHDFEQDEGVSDGQGSLVCLVQFSQFSHSVVSDSLRPHELQHARPPYPSPTPGVYPNSCALSW